MTEVEPADLRDLFGQMRRDGRTTSEIKKTRAALSVMFATALEDGIVQSNPVLGVRIPPPSEDEAPRDDKAKALTRAELAILLAAIPSESRLFCTLALADLGLIDEYEFLVQPVLAGHGPTLLAGLRERIQLELVHRHEFRSGAVAMRFRPTRVPA
jgi:hypothetical protein